MLCDVWFAWSRSSNYAKNHFFHGFIMFFDCKSSTLERCTFSTNQHETQTRFWTTFILVKNSSSVTDTGPSSLDSTRIFDSLLNCFDQETVIFSSKNVISLAKRFLIFQINCLVTMEIRGSMLDFLINSGLTIKLFFKPC